MTNAAASSSKISGVGEATNGLSGQLIELRRLLHCIEKTNGNSEIHTWHLSARVDLAFTLLHQIQDQLDHDINNTILTDLQNSVRQAQVMTYLEIARRSSLAAKNKDNEMQQPTFQDSSILQSIFFPNKPKDLIHPGETKEEAIENLNLAHHDEHNQLDSSFPTLPVEQSEMTAIAQNSKATNEDIPPIETTLEEEIAEMAYQLKLSTLSVNDNLRIQTKELSSMEDLVTQNLERVTNVTETVTEQVRRRRWTKQLGTWALLISVLATFCGTFFIVRYVPKRYRRGGSNHPYTTSWNQQQRSGINYNDKSARGDAEHLVDIDEQSENSFYETEYKKNDASVPFSSATCQSSENGDNKMECIVKNGHHDDGNINADLEDVDDILWQRISERKRQRIAERTLEAEAEEVTKEKIKIRTKGIKDDHSVKSQVVGVEGEDNENIIDDPRRELLEDEELEKLGNLLRGAAASGHIPSNILDRCVEAKLIDSVDKNGWSALHEGIRSGNIDLVETLIQAGADINRITHFGQGETPLELAQIIHGNDHGVVELLRHRMSE